jgi:hypothetical protein
MYLNGHEGYVGGDQYATGDFLIIFEKPAASIHERPLRPELRALVRRVRLRQTGHFMMGSAQIAGKHTVALSGAYGGDGLPCDLKDDQGHLWERLHPLPPELQDAFWGGGGHNTVGREWPKLWRWALCHLDELRHLRPVV